jgi:hypothetical protein
VNPLSPAAFRTEDRAAREERARAREQNAKLHVLEEGQDATKKNARSVLSL